MHIDPVTHAMQHYGAIERRETEIQSAQNSLLVAFVKACQGGDANATAWFAPMVTDWDSIKHRPIAVGEYVPQRLQVMHEVMAEAFDYSKGPQLAQVMQLVLNVAFGSDLVNAPRQARELLAQAADTWAFYNVEADE